jgi:hypothetical protein
MFSKAAKTLLAFADFQLLMPLQKSNSQPVVEGFHHFPNGQQLPEGRGS